MGNISNLLILPSVLLSHAEAGRVRSRVADTSDPTLSRSESAARQEIEVEASKPIEISADLSTTLPRID
jgi:hypothetical protein